MDDREKRGLGGDVTQNSSLSADDFGLEIVELEGAEVSTSADGETVFFRSTTTCSTSTC